MEVRVEEPRVVSDPFRNDQRVALGIPHRSQNSLHLFKLPSVKESNHILERSPPNFAMIAGRALIQLRFRWGY